MLTSAARTDMIVTGGWAEDSIFDVILYFYISPSICTQLHTMHRVSLATPYLLLANTTFLS